ncbi:hypothetical protein [Flavobacterium sp. ZT3R18]|uniref:hypothetical protein n=1 Tax=Flavobacterium sp. ZT3R18 TaxID=2594429 RepID=UPI00163D9475|nr:hypothetical protein [Flavobacterium sp. ZT3R18]
MTVHEKTHLKLKDFETKVQELIQELEAEKVKKKDIDKVRLILTKCQSAKSTFNDN